MKIVIPIHSFEPGGVERTALLLAQQWQHAGHDVVVILGRTDGPMKDIAPGLRYEVTPTRWSTAWWETVWMMVCLYKYLKAKPADIMFCPGNTYAVVVGMMCLLLGRQCPPIISKISNDLARLDMPQPARSFYRLWLLFQAAFTDVFVGMASPMRAEIARFTRADSNQIEIIEDPSLTPTQYRALSRIERRERAPHEGLNFLSIGRLAPQKNYSLLISAFAEAAGPNDRLIIVGEGPERSRLEQLAVRLGVAGRIVLPGHTQDTIPSLAASDVFVLSSDYEGVPAVILEALASGLPIIATQCSVSMNSLLQDGRLGKLVEVGNRSAFANAIKSAAFLRQDQDGARRQAVRFTVDRAATAYLRLFTRLLQSRRTQVGAGRQLASITQM